MCSLPQFTNCTQDQVQEEAVAKAQAPRFMGFPWRWSFPDGHLVVEAQKWYTGIAYYIVKTWYLRYLNMVNFIKINHIPNTKKQLKIVTPILSKHGIFHVDMYISTHIVLGYN